MTDMGIMGQQANPTSNDQTLVDALVLIQAGGLSARTLNDIAKRALEDYAAQKSNQAGPASCEGDGFKAPVAGGSLPNTSAIEPTLYVKHPDGTYSEYTAFAHETSATPVAYVPIHPRTGALWANTVPSLASERPAHYPVMALYSTGLAEKASVPLSTNETQQILGAASHEPMSIPAALDRFSRRHDASDIPRSADMLRWIPEEHRIRDALVAVEALGAHPLLTEAVDKLAQAQRDIADWHDGGRPGAAL